MKVDIKNHGLGESVQNGKILSSREKTSWRAAI